MLGNVFNRSFSILKRKPIVLWSTSVACTFITIIIELMFATFPFVSIPAVLTLSAGMAALYLDGYNGVEITSEQLFRGFSKKHKCFPRVTLGMLWHSLWSLIWIFVPIAGIVKTYQYSFTPYILLSRPEVSPVDALSLSKKETSGYKLLMFAADVIISLACILILSLCAVTIRVPVLGLIICAAGVVLLVIVTPLLRGLVMAGFYQEAQNEALKRIYYQQNYERYQQSAGTYNEQPYQNAEKPNNPNQPEGDNKWFCVKCGAHNESDAMFCTRCGNKRSTGV